VKPSLIEARDLSFAYRRGRSEAHVLQRVSLAVPRGAMIALLGPNGSGKTTLLRLVAGVLEPLSGEVLLDGQRLDQISRLERARRIAMVAQETRTTFDFIVIDMVLMGRYPHLGPFELEGADDLQIARSALEATGCADLESRRFGSLSGGEKQRVIIASALAQASELLLLDEPGTALDLRYQFEMLDVLRRLNREQDTTLVIATHDLTQAAALCDHVVLLKQGRVLAYGPTHETLTTDAVRALYGVEAEVRYHARAGHLTVVPLDRAE
jgi:iron complex transport system ATP-binding protein